MTICPLAPLDRMSDATANLAVGNVLQTFIENKLLCSYCNGVLEKNMAVAMSSS